MEDCQENTRDTGINLFQNFTMEQCDRLTGDKIFIDLESRVSYMSAYYFSKWKGGNKDAQVIVKGNRVTGYPHA